MNTRDKKLIAYLKHFRVLSRDQLAQMLCPEVAKPYATINRIAKRLYRDGHILQIPRPMAESYLYMPNPALIHTESTKIRHYLAIADFYIRIGMPKVYGVEPQLDEEYKPDVYAHAPYPVLLEIQRTHTSNRRMQAKVDGFVRTYKQNRHDAKELWIVANEMYKVSAPKDFTIKQIPL